MAVRDLVFYPDPVLRTACEPVVEFDNEIGQLMDDLAESMYAHKGVGLAAPQIDVGLKALVVDVNQEEDQSELLEVINPEIVETSPERSEFEEGCLSFPGESELVVRPARVTVRAQDRSGKPFEIQADGMLATALQHEIDHLNGVVFIDHISRLKRSLVERRMKKRAKAAAS
jgi:peptide deformylase